MDQFHVICVNGGLLACCWPLSSVEYLRARAHNGLGAATETDARGVAHLGVLRWARPLCSASR